MRVIGIRDNHVLQEVSYGTRAVPTEIQLSEDQLHIVTNDVPMVGEPSVSVWMLCIDPDKVDGKARQEAEEYYFEQGNKHKEYAATATVRKHWSNVQCLCYNVHGCTEPLVVLGSLIVPRARTHARTQSVTHSLAT